MKRRFLTILACVFMLINVFVFVACGNGTIVDLENEFKPTISEGNLDNEFKPTVSEGNKEFSNISIDANFDDSCVVVVLDESVGGINKIHDKSYFGDFGIESIKDLTYMEGNIEDRKYFNKDNFKQILQLNLTIKTKENVIKVLQELEKVEGIYYACPSYYEKIEPHT